MKIITNKANKGSENFIIDVSSNIEIEEEVVAEPQQVHEVEMVPAHQ